MKRRFGDTQPDRRIRQFFHFDVRRDSTATIEHASHSSLYSWSTVRGRRSQRQRRLQIAWSIRGRRRRRRLVGIVSCVVIVKRTARIIALQRTAIRCVVTRGRQRQTGIERQRKYSLDQPFAETRFTDNQPAPVVLNRPGNNLRSRSAVTIDEHDER